MAADGGAMLGLPDLRGAGVAVKVFIPSHARRMMLEEARGSADGRETGGILLGFEETGGGRYWVTQVGDPGAHAERSATRFLRDLDHAEALAEQAYRIDHSQWIGDWHTHPGGPAALSHTDLDSYRSVLAHSDMGAFLAILVLPRADGWRQPRVSAWQVTASTVESVLIADLLNERAW